MENDPAQLRAEAVQPLLGSEARVEYYDNKLEWVPQRFGLRRAAETVYPYAQKALKTMDWLGGKFANGLGLTSSRFQYALDEYNRRERKMLEKIEQEKAKSQAIKHQQGLVDEDDSRMPYVPPMSLIFIQSEKQQQQQQQENPSRVAAPVEAVAASVPSQEKKPSAAANDDDDDDAQAAVNLSQEMKNL